MVLAGHSPLRWTPDAKCDDGVCLLIVRQHTPQTANKIKFQPSAAQKTIKLALVLFSFVRRDVRSLHAARLEAQARYDGLSESQIPIALPLA
jgi:hypothetical protein